MDKFTTFGKMVIWVFGCIALTLFLSCSFILIPALHLKVIQESIVICTAGYTTVIFCITLFEIVIKARHQEQTQKIKDAIYDAYIYMVFMFVVSAIAYIFFDVKFLTLIRLLHSSIYFSLIYNGLKLIEWPAFRQWIADKIGGIEAYHVTQAWNITLLAVYGTVLSFSTYFLITREATWRAYWWILLFLILTVHEAWNIWNTYKKRTKGSSEVKKKQKALDKAEAALDRADKNLQKFHSEKESFQTKIEKKIKENPNCPESDIDVLMAEFDRYDSRIRMAEQMKQNLETQVIGLRNEIQDIRNNDTEAPENQVRMRVGRTGRGRTVYGQHLADVVRTMGAEHIELNRRERVTDLLSYRVIYLRDTLQRIVDVEANIQTQLNNVHNQEREVFLLEKQRELEAISTEIRRAAHNYVGWANALLADHNNQEAFDAMTAHGQAFIDIQNRVADFERADTTLQLNIISANFIAVPHNAITDVEDIESGLQEVRRTHIDTARELLGIQEDADGNWEDDHMGTDGYPICPNCHQEHNCEGGQEHNPYCSEDCKFADTHCAICLKETNPDDAIGWTCSSECNEEYHRRQGNGD
jgi:hypothetical protein